MQKKFENRTAGFYIGLAGGILAIAAVIIYAVNMSALAQSNILVILPLILVAATEILLIFKESDWVMLLAPILCSVALSAFAVDSVGTLVDYFFNLTMFGNKSTMGVVTTLLIMMLITLVALIVKNFMKRDREA